MSSQLEESQDPDNGEKFQNICIFQVRSKISKTQVNVETESSDEVNDIDRASDKVEYIRTREESDEELEGEPSIADTLDIEESIVSIGAVLVQGPGCQVPPCPDGDVPDHRHPHVRVSLQTEGQDGDTDEKDRDNPNELDDDDCNDDEQEHAIPWQH